MKKNKIKILNRNQNSAVDATHKFQKLAKSKKILLGIIFLLEYLVVISTSCLYYDRS